MEGNVEDLSGQQRGMGPLGGAYPVPDLFSLDQAQTPVVEPGGAGEVRRERLAKLVHDQLQQLLVAARLEMGTLRRHSSDAVFLAGIESVDGLIRQALDVSRTMEMELNQPALGKGGLKMNETMGERAHAAARPHAHGGHAPASKIGARIWDDEGTGGGALPGDPGAAMSRTGKTLRVLLADDHKILREGLVSLLELEPDIEVVGEASDGQMAVDLAHTLHPDVVIMDVTMPRLNGVEATRRIKAESPEVSVIGLSMHAREDMSAAMRQAGACAYFTKGGPSELLISAIRACGGD